MEIVKILVKIRLWIVQSGTLEKYGNPLASELESICIRTISLMWFLLLIIVKLFAEIMLNIFLFYLQM